MTGLKRCVFNLCLKMSSEGAVCKIDGSLFQVLGPHTEKARSPRPILAFGTIRWPWTFDLRFFGWSTVFMKSLRYAGASPWRNLYTSRQILKMILALIGSQCSCLIIGDIYGHTSWCRSPNEQQTSAGFPAALTDSLPLHTEEHCLDLTWML